MGQLEALSKIGIDQTAIETKDYPDFPKLTPKESKKLDRVYNGALVDKVIVAFYEDVDGLLQQQKNLIEDFNDLATQKDEFVQTIQELREDKGLEKELDLRLTAFEQLMDRMEEKLNEIVSSNQSTLDRITSLEAERDQILEKAKEQQAVIDSLSTRTITQSDELREKDQTISELYTSVEQLESDINQVIEALANKLHAYGISIA